MAIPIPMPTGQVGGFHASLDAPEAREELHRKRFADICSWENMKRRGCPAPLPV